MVAAQGAFGRLRANTSRLAVIRWARRWAGVGRPADGRQHGKVPWRTPRHSRAGEQSGACPASMDGEMPTAMEKSFAPHGRLLFVARRDAMRARKQPCWVPSSGLRRNLAELQLLVGFSAPLALDNIRPRQLLLFAHLMAALALLSVSLGFAIPSVRPTIAPRAPHPIAPRAPHPIAKVAVEQFVTDLEFLGPVRASSLPMPSCALPKPGQIVGLH
jgi:hypothetical protein